MRDSKNYSLVRQLELCYRYGVRASGPSPLRITIQVRSENGQDVFFLCRLSTKMFRLFAAFCCREGLERCGLTREERDNGLLSSDGLACAWIGRRSLGLFDGRVWALSEGLEVSKELRGRRLRRGMLKEVWKRSKW